MQVSEHESARRVVGRVKEVSAQRGGRCVKDRWTQRWLRCVSRSLQLGVIAGTAAVARPALAHGPAPSAVAVVAQDDLGPRVVRLTSGLALRQPDGSYGYLCPALWSDTDAVGAYGLPGQPVVILASSGLHLLHDDGTVTPHPDPLAAGSAFDIAALGGKLYVLRIKGSTGSEIVEVTSEAVKSIWTDTQLWTTLAAGDDYLALARLGDGDDVDQLRLSPEGTVLDKASANGPPAPLIVFARTLGHELYLAVTANGGRTLGQLKSGSFVTTQNASAAIAGPVQASSGAVFVALDSALDRMDGATLTPITTDTPINCLSHYETHSYACTREGVQALLPEGLGALSFQLAQLTAPKLDKLTGTAADTCGQQWEHLRFDLLGLGITLNSESLAAGGAAALAQAGSAAQASATQAGTGALSAAGTAGDPRAGVPAAIAPIAGMGAAAGTLGAAPQAGASAPPTAAAQPARSGGCSIGRHGSARLPTSLAIMLALCASSRRARRQRSPAWPSRSDF
jgi:hypothetical protein